MTNVWKIVIPTFETSASLLLVYSIMMVRREKVIYDLTSISFEEDTTMDKSVQSERS